MCSVYLRAEDGGAVCVADLTTKEEAFEYAAAISKARGWEVDGSIYELRIREVPPARAIWPIRASQSHSPWTRRRRRCTTR